MATAGYSGTPLPQKLGIEEGSRVALVGAPIDVARLVGGKTERGLTGKEPFDVILLFASSQKALIASFDHARARLREDGGLWICWPKRASGVATDLNENLVRDLGLAAGLVDNKVCAIDATWSGLRLVVRVRDRKGTR